MAAAVAVAVAVAAGRAAAGTEIVLIPQRAGNLYPQISQIAQMDGTGNVFCQHMKETINEAVADSKQYAKHYHPDNSVPVFAVGRNAAPITSELVQQADDEQQA